MTLKKNFQLITDLFNAHPDPVVLIDNFFNIQWMNPAFSRWHSSYVTDANQTVNKGGVNLLSFFKSDIAIKDLQDAVQQSKGERLWAQVAGQTIELTVSPIQSDDIHTIIYIKPWQTPNPEHLPSEWTAYASLLHNPFIGIWKLGFEEPIDISNGSREIAEQMFETGIFIECNEAMAKMYGFTDRMSMLGQPVKILYSDREPAIQRIISMINNDFKSEMKDSIEIDQHGRTCAFRSAYYGNIEKGNLDWVWGFQMEISEQYKTELLFQVLYRIAHSVLITPNLSELFKSIQKDLARIVNTTNFYIVTVDEKSDEIIMQYNVDSAGNLNPPSLQSMVAKIISENKARLLTKPDIYKLKEDGIIELEEPYPNSWLGIPLVLGDRVIGALVLQSYDLRIYTDEDLKLLQFVTDQIALAIERKQAAEKSENYRLKLESLIRNVPEAIYTCLDRLGSTTFISDKWERWTGLSTEELIADPMSWSNSIHPDDRDMTVQLFKKACDQGEDYLLHYRVIHRTSGEITYLRDHGIRIKDNKGIHYEGIISDVTDYRLTESRLRASLKEKEILLREVHHRIKNNLQVISS
ncbi:PAS domain-containing protein, partial [bacterium]|nr:PAS domain-containing protein [bacterium]